MTRWAAIAGAAVLVGAGVVCIVAAAWMVYPPAAIFLAGAALVTVGVVFVDVPSREE